MRAEIRAVSRDDTSSRKTVLFVVHDQELHSLVAGALNEFDLLVARNDSEAFVALDHLTPDIVLLDARCAALNAVQTCRSLRRGWPEGPQLLVLLAADTQQDRIALYEAGADDVIQLPVNPVEILAKCRVHGGLRREAQLSRLKSHVLDMFAHELRTPLTGILLAAETLGSKYGADGQDRDWFDLIGDCTRRLELLADHGLLLCKLRANMLEISLKECDLAAMVQKVMKEQEPTANTHRVRLELRAPDPVQAHVDPHYFQILLRYLIEGTLRWCRPESTLFLSLGADDDGAWLSLSAWTVPALADAEHPFSEFAPRTAGGQLVGGHFGLSLVRELILAQGGTFELVSTKSDELWLTCHLLRKPPERRNASRFPTEIAGRLALPEPVPIHVIDVSTTGCLVETAAQLPVEFQAGGAEAVRGRVVRVIPRDGRLRLGVQFDTALTADATAALLVGREPTLAGPGGRG